jgi:CBS domain-containing protein
MNVGTICKRQIVTVTPRTDVTAAAELMRQKHVGFLIVVEPEFDPERGPVTHGRPVGVLTDRDIVTSVVARGADPRDLTAADIMSREPSTVGETEPLDNALRMMHRLGIRRLPVVGPEGLLTGVLSLDDVIAVLSSELGDVSGAVRNEQRIEGVLRT